MSKPRKKRLTNNRRVQKKSRARIHYPLLDSDPIGDQLEVELAALNEQRAVEAEFWEVIRPLWIAAAGGAALLADAHGVLIECLVLAVTALVIVSLVSIALAAEADWERTMS